MIYSVKRNLSAVLAALMLIPVLVSCSEDTVGADEGFFVKVVGTRIHI